MQQPARTSGGDRLPLSATILVGGLAVLGAITLLGWLVGAIIGIVRAVLLIVVVLALISWVAGRRLDR